MKKLDVIIRKRSKDGRYYFVRQSANNKKVMRSDFYQTYSGRWKAIFRISENERVIVK